MRESAKKIFMIKTLLEGVEGGGWRELGSKIL